jgi:hypothetical protein
MHDETATNRNRETIAMSRGGAASVARGKYRELSDFLRLNHLFYRTTAIRASIEAVKGLL